MSNELRRCAICAKQEPLRDSHIVPKFIARQQKNTSATGYFIDAAEPNRRAQDSFKIPLLCSACEEILSAQETKMAPLFAKMERTFAKHGVTGELPEYDNHCLKFAMGLAFRATLYLEIRSDTRSNIPSLWECLEGWRAALLNNTIHGRHYAFIVPDRFEEYDAEKYPDFHWYLHRTTSLSIGRLFGKHAILVKMPRIGFISSFSGRIRELERYEIHCAGSFSRLLPDQHGPAAITLMRHLFPLSLQVTEAINEQTPKRSEQINKSLMDKLEQARLDPEAYSSYAWSMVADNWEQFIDYAAQKGSDTENL